MTTLEGPIPRTLAIAQAREAIAIAASGRYIAPSGGTVDLSELVRNARAETVSYPPQHPFAPGRPGPYPTVVEVENETTLSAARRLLESGLDPVVLNFASATSPGGGFLIGARAQEEYLARASTLYECIRDNEMYAFHRARNDPLYTDYVIYSPRVPVFRDDSGSLLEEPYTVGMITSPAVHANGVPRDRRHEIEPAMQGRIQKVLSTGLAHGHDGIVLGAWGCGAFGNDGTTIARLFRETIEGDFRGSYRRIVFAIVDWSAEGRFIGPFEAAFRNA